MVALKIQKEFASALYEGDYLKPFFDSLKN